MFSQSVDDSFTKKNMRKDLAVFKEVRLKANSGLYKYRSKVQMDSIYKWADNEIEKSSSYREFYNVICKLTDYEGSLHNETFMPDNVMQNLRKETTGYFPFPVKWVDGKWLINFENGEVPLGSEIISIEDVSIEEIISNINKYYTTDGDNLTGKRIGIRTHFAKYYRLHYGLKDNFRVNYKVHNSNSVESKVIKSVSYSVYYNNFYKRYSSKFDNIYYQDLDEDKKYNFKNINDTTALLTIYTFSMGNENSKEHHTYVAFLDSIFSSIKKNKIKNLIVDVRQNGGGTDPNDIVTYSYLTQRNFQENKKAWISFYKIPLLKYYNTKIPKPLRPLLIGKFNKEFQEIFTKEVDNKFYQDENSDDHKVRSPNKNAFNGKIYLLISPAIASAGSLFASMVAGNKNTTTIGEETMGGYFGHNGHTPMEYKLPKSKMVLQFSVVNLEQDVVKKENQFYNRGIIPDYNISQTYEDFLKHGDTQLDFVLDFIKSKKE